MIRNLSFVVPTLLDFVSKVYTANFFFGLENYNLQFLILECQEYKKYSSVFVSITGLPFERDNTPVAVSKCDSELPVIVGGEITKVGEFPHMAAIGWGSKGYYRFDCGGSLISEYFVLTGKLSRIKLELCRSSLDL